MNLQGLTKISKTVGGFVTKNSPTILTGLSVAGVLATVVMGGKATIKALSILDDEYAEMNPSSKIQPAIHELTDEFTAKEMFKLTWKCYVPTAILGTITMGCIMGANSISLKRNAALAGLYSLSEKALKEYQEKVVEKMGEAKHKEIKEEIIKEKMEKNPVSNNEVIITGRGESLCYDSQSGRYFKSDMTTIEAALNKMNRRLMNENTITLNEVYSELGLEGIKLGDIMGWDSAWGQIEPDFGSHIAEDGRPCLVLDFDMEPRYIDRDSY
jgi:hypothetical protein